MFNAMQFVIKPQVVKDHLVPTARRGSKTAKLGAAMPTGIMWVSDFQPQNAKAQICERQIASSTLDQICRSVPVISLDEYHLQTSHTLCIFYGK
jgi:hypothetical protein